MISVVCFDLFFVQIMGRWIGYLKVHCHLLCIQHLFSYWEYLFQTSWFILPFCGNFSLLFS